MFGAGSDVFAVWSYVIANAKDGHVELNPGLLAATVGTTTDRIDTAIEWLCRPDPASRNPAEHGRRLIREGQYQFCVTSHALYRSIRNEEDRRAYNRQKQRESRARRKPVKPRVYDSQSMSALSAYTDTDTEYRDQSIETEEKKAQASSRPTSGRPSANGSLVSAYHDLFVAKFGVKPAIHGGKDGAILKQLAASHGEATVKDMLHSWGLPPSVQSTRDRGCWVCGAVTARYVDRIER